MSVELEVKGIFVKDKVCKNSIVYKPKDEIASEVASAIYLSKVGLNCLGNPKELIVKISVDAADMKG